MFAKYRVSIRTACSVLSMNCSSYYYKGHRDEQTELRMNIKDYATSRYGTATDGFMSFCSSRGLRSTGSSCTACIALKTSMFGLLLEENRFPGHETKR